MLRPGNRTGPAGESPVRVACRSGVGVELPQTDAAVNLFPRASGGCFRTGDAGDKFGEPGRYVAWRLRRLLINKRGRNLRAGQADGWTRTWFGDQGLHQLVGTIGYPKAA